MEEEYLKDKNMAYVYIFLIVNNCRVMTKFNIVFPVLLPYVKHKLITGWNINVFLIYVLGQLLRSMTQRNKLNQAMATRMIMVRWINIVVFGLFMGIVAN